MAIPIGVSLPHYGPDASPESVRVFAEAAEAAGLASLWAIERTLRPLELIDYQLGLGTVEMPSAYATVFSPLETLTFVAARTSRIRLGTSAIECLFHVPAILARRLATLDRYCDGRLTVGLGQGYSPAEFEAANVPMSRRGRGFDEFVAAVRAAWSPDPVEFHGDFYRIPRSEIGPKPLQPDGPPLLMAAASLAASERAGRLGIGLNPQMVTWEMLDEQLAAHRKGAGVDLDGPPPAPVVLRVTLQDGGTRFQLGERGPGDYDERSPFNGAPNQIAADLNRAAASGISEVLFDLVSHGAPLERQLELLPMLASLQAG